MDTGVDDVLGDTRVSDPHSISGYSQPDPSTEAILQEMEEQEALELQDDAMVSGKAAQSEAEAEEQDETEEGAQEQTEEITFTLPFRQGSFWRTWLMSFFVVDRYSIRMYPNEKRNERKMKEILLVDAMVQVEAGGRCIVENADQFRRQTSVLRGDPARPELGLHEIVRSCAAFGRGRRRIHSNDPEVHQSRSVKPIPCLFQPTRQ